MTVAQDGVRRRLLDAGKHDRAVLAVSLVPPGATVAVVGGAPPRTTELLRSYGHRVGARDDADVVIGGPSEIGAEPLAIVTGEHAGHGSADRTTAGRPGCHSLDDFMSVSTAHGRHLLGCQRFFEPFATTGDGDHLQSDPRAWIRWMATLSGPRSQAPPPPRARHVPKHAVVLLADEPFARWDEGTRRATLDLVDELRRRDTTLVISWSPKRLTGSLAAHVELTRAGILLHGGDGVFDVETDPENIVAPEPWPLVGGYGPAVVVVMDQESGGDALGLAVVRALRTRFLGLGLSAGFLDGTTSVGGLVADVTASLADHRREPVGGAPPVDRRSRRRGVTSVVIPVHGRWDLTDACLRSLRENTSHQLDIIVVDNASSDETPARLAEQPDVRVVTCPTNLGFAGGTNRGIELADGEFVCLLNNDTEVMPGWLEALKAALAVPATGVVGPRCNRISGLQIVPNAPSMADPGVREWGVMAARAGGERTWLASRLVGFCMLMKGELLEEIGSLDEGVGLGNFEDDELCQRVQDRQLTLRVADGAVVLHHGSATFSSSGISPLATMRAGARHVGTRLRRHSSLLVARVVGEGDPTLVEETVNHALLLADQIIVACRDDTLPHALRTKHLDPVAVDVVDALAARPTRAPWVLHLPAGVILDTTEWGHTRAAIEALPRRVHRIEGLADAVLAPTVGGWVDAPPCAEGAPTTDVIRRAVRT